MMDELPQTPEPRAVASGGRGALESRSTVSRCSSTTAVATISTTPKSGIGSRPMQCHGTLPAKPLRGSKFADDLGEDELFTGLIDRLDSTNAIGKLDEAGNHQHILEWPGAGAGGEGRVEVWVSPNGRLGGMWPVR